MNTGYYGDYLKKNLSRMTSRYSKPMAQKPIAQPTNEQQRLSVAQPTANPQQQQQLAQTNSAQRQPVPQQQPLTTNKPLTAVPQQQGTGMSYDAARNQAMDSLSRMKLQRDLQNRLGTMNRSTTLFQ